MNLFYLTRFWVICLVAMSSIVASSQVLHAQTNPAARVSISPATLTVKELLAQLTKNSGLNFVYSNIDEELGKTITLDPSSGSLRTILQQIASKTRLVLSASGNDIALKLRAKGTISGAVTTSDGEPARLVTVTIKGLRSTQVDPNGHYIFKNIPAGTYTLTATFVGLEAASKNVTLESAEGLHADFVLKESKQELKEVVVGGSSVNKYGRKESDYIARLPIKNLENPQVYSVVRKELITAQMVTTLDEAFRNIPGGVVSRTGAGIPAVTARGFTSGDNIRNGMATFLKTNIDPIIVERVESIKGPSSTLYGSTMVSFGGLINYVIKRPYDTFGGEVGYTQGSFDLSRLTADINMPLNEDKSLLFRVTGANHKENSFQDQGFQHLQVISPSLTYQINEKLKFSIDADFHKVKGTSSVLLTIPNNVFNGKSFKDLPFSYRQSLIDNSLASQQASNNVFAQAEYKISENWKSQTNYAYSLGTYDQFNQFDYTYTNETTLTRKVRVWMPDKWGRKQIQQNFIGDFKTGPFRHRLLVGGDYMAQYRQSHYGMVNLDVLSNINDPAKPIPSINLAQVNNAYASINAPENISSQDAYSAYASDLVNLTDRLMVMLSLRADRFLNRGTKNLSTNILTGDYNQTAFSPKLGLIFQPIKEQVSIFANYMNGFKNLPNATQPDGTVSVFKVQQANQFEGGVKMDLFEHKLNATLSYYNIDVKDATRNEERNNNQKFLVQDGTQQSKGFDLDIIFNPIEGLNIIAGYGYNDNKYTKTSIEFENKRAVLSPAHVGNAWINYSFPEGALKGFGLGIGGNYVSDSYFANTRVRVGTTSNYTDYSFILPSYTFVDISASYDQPKFRINFKANNVGNVKSWAIDGRPQKPSNFLAGVAFKF